MTDDHRPAKKLFPSLEILPWQSILGESSSNLSCQASDEETAVILFTSGTTGVSKGCDIPHRSSVRAAESMIEAFNLTEKDCVYTPYPLVSCRSHSVRHIAGYDGGRSSNYASRF